MLLHITPKLLTAHAFSTAGLASVEIPEFRLKLSGEKELMTRKPFSNKRYYVGCRRSGKASSGFLLELPHTVDEYTVISEWETVSGLHTHTVRYVVLDNELDAASDEMLLWPGDGAIFSDRCPEYVKSLTPVNYARSWKCIVGHIEANAMTSMAPAVSSWSANRASVSPPSKGNA